MKLGERTKVWYIEHSNIGNCVVGDDCVLHSHIWIGDGVVIGNRVKVQAFSFIPPVVTIEDDVFIGPRVTFTNDKYPNVPGNPWSETLVKCGAVVGAGAVILPGLTLGKGCIVGAGSVVTKSVPPNQTVVGNPARVLHKGG